MEATLSEMQKGIQNTNRETLPSLYPSSVTSVNALENVHLNTLSNADAPTVHELMVLLGGDQSASKCWFCHVMGHRYTQCEKFRKWIYAGKDATTIPALNA